LLAETAIVEPDTSTAAAIDNATAKLENRVSKAEMAKVADKAWSKLGSGESSPSVQLGRMADSMKGAYRKLLTGMTPAEREENKSVLEIADFYANKSTPTKRLSIRKISLAILDWHDFLKGNPGHSTPPPRITQPSIDLVRKSIALEEDDFKMGRCACFGHELGECKPYVEDEYHKLRDYDSGLNRLVLRLVGSHPDQAKDWTNVGESLNLSALKKTLGFASDALSREKEVAESLAAYAKSHELIDTGTESVAK
jgi:hypothetical protein